MVPWPGGRDIICEDRGIGESLSLFKIYAEIPRGNIKVIVTRNEIALAGVYAPL